ncbi:hypothetical protein B5M42_015455 [Paenibacillus athensensis]|uniref:Uncharacterized protein n=1 Tax=Paenibacillus athensensis TaxID=1967502 RepID=A0A4Y8Q9Z7_9BACL|nr:hypothetical protein [Paenibacillus athensensis]MCD1260208.1 hypothetical protein [Paenibacillus athensensis]
MSLTISLQDAIGTVSRLLAPTGVRWLIGGSSGLILQRVALAGEPRDLDLYIDGSDVAVAYGALRDYALDVPFYSETDIYASILSHYEVAGVTVELVGAFRVAANGSTYQVEAGYLWSKWAAQITQQHMSDGGASTIRLTPLAHELLFNLLRGRADRYEPIAEAMRRDPASHMAALAALLARGRWSEQLLGQLADLGLTAGGAAAR